MKLSFSSSLFLLFVLQAFSNAEPEGTGRSLPQPYPYYKPTLETDNYKSHDLEKEIAEIQRAESDEFYDLINKILWDSEEEETGRSLRRHGLFQRKMPEMLKTSSKTLPSRMYRTFTDQCYTWACKLGISRMARDLNRLFG